ncbi:M4 family metallopeptidase [Moritella sp. 5]|uniref:M4 family metallopeptidase n=1 Tax=Moritella sp. 5 TaxID=2746231 RepID=UPI001BAAB0AB|nr:M4 family metallopeptidase [Moritella sp. 5]QUM80065.1 M4 family metallopeptidase [Moritella sp. 5]
MMANKKFILSAVAFSLLSSVNTIAAERVNLRDSMQKLATATLIDPGILASAPAQLLGLSRNDGLRVIKTYLNNNGDTITRYQQTYFGLPVIGEQAVISHNKNGFFKRAHGAVLNNIADDIFDITPLMTKVDALLRAKRLSIPASPLVISQSIVTENETSRLAVWQDDDGVARLVYEVSFFQIADEPSRPYYIIDAQSGEVLRYLENLQTADATGPGGNYKTAKYRYGSDFKALNVSQSGDTCTMSNEHLKTVNLNHEKEGATAFSFTCPENTVKQINGAYSPLNDAHFFGGVIFDMYNDWLNISPLTSQLVMRVHYDNNYENAFWNGESMTFGDGADTFYPLVSLDVSAHEVSHGFTEQNSGLVYSGKSGGLNESFSDMAGEAAEFYMHGSNDWLVGAQILKGSGALRSMSDPTMDGKSIDNQADYRYLMNVHHSSGVYNKAFYNLATTSGWDTEKAFVLYATANQLYWTPNSNWDDAGNGVMDAACDLGYSVDDVLASLTAVGIVADVKDDSECSVTPPPAIEIDRVESNISTSLFRPAHFKQELDEGYTRLTVTLAGGTGNADLYVKHGDKSLFSKSDCISKTPSNIETCVIDNPKAGIWKIDIRSYGSTSDVILNIQAK